MTFRDGEYPLRRLHSRLLNSLDVYKSVTEQTENREAAILLESYCSTRARHISELDRLMLSRELEPQEDGSWLTDAQSLPVDGLHTTRYEKVEAGVIRIENMILGLYGNALESMPHDRDAVTMLTRHRHDVQAQLDRINPVQ